MNNYIRSTLMAATMALGALGLGLTSASAATITSTSATVSGSDVGTSWEVNYICSAAFPCNGGTPFGTLGARTTFSLLEYVEDAGMAYWKIDLTIRNTSNLLAGGFLTAIGFSTDPDAVIDSFWDANSVLADWVVGNGSIPGFGNTEICVYDGNNCSAANDHVMTPGTQDRVTFWLETDLSDGSSLTFSDFAARWAGNAVTEGSFDAGGTIKVAPVPLPAAGGLLLLGLGGLALLRRGRKAA